MKAKNIKAFLLCMIYLLCLFSLTACDTAQKDFPFPPYYEKLRDGIGKPWEDVVKSLGMNPKNATEFGNGFYIILPEKAEFSGYPMYVVLKIQPEFRENPGTVLSFSYYYEYGGDTKESEFRAAAEDVFKLQEAFTQRHGEAKPFHTAPLGSTVEELYEAFCNPRQSMEFAQIGEWDFSDGMTFTAGIGPYKENEMILSLTYFPTP